MSSPNATLNAREWVLMHYDVTIHTEWQEFSNYTYAITTQETADCYQVYIAKRTDEHMFVEEHLYYYNHHFEQLLADVLPNLQGETIFIDEECLDLNTCEWQVWKQQIQEQEYE